MLITDSLTAPPVELRETETRAPYSASPFTGPPIFISGCNRGGTTVLTRLLGIHPEVGNIGQSQFCEGQYIWKRHFPDPSRHRWAIRPWFWWMRRTEKDATPGRLEFFRRAFQEAMPTPGRMLEKTPANAVRIPFLDALYPDCHFVHLIRDGRHTTASLIARRVWWPYAPHQWVGAHRTALADLTRLPSERVIEVRYEELTSDPERVLNEICRRCGLAWGAAERDLLVENARKELREVDCRWERLPGYQKRYALSVIRDLQAELGYPVETSV